MEQWAALVEWESGGLADVPSENMRYALNELLAEFAKRGDMPCDPVAWMDPSGKFEERAFSFSAETGWLPLMLMTPNAKVRGPEAALSPEAPSRLPGSTP